MPATSPWSSWPSFWLRAPRVSIKISLAIQLLPFLGDRGVREPETIHNRSGGPPGPWEPPRSPRRLPGLPFLSFLWHLQSAKPGGPKGAIESTLLGSPPAVDVDSFWFLTLETWIYLRHQKKSAGAGRQAGCQGRLKSKNHPENSTKTILNRFPKPTPKLSQKDAKMDPSPKTVKTAKRPPKTTQAAPRHPSTLQAA